jgi:hypothetical protein
MFWRIIMANGFVVLLTTVLVMWRKHLIVLQTLSSRELTTLPPSTKNMIKKYEKNKNKYANL